jgi:guanylate kinase
MTGILFIISAASGTGKTSLVNRLLSEEPSLALSVSYTTRAPRAGEKDGREYHFVDIMTFERMIANGDFLEYASIYGNYYGTSLSAIEGQLQKQDVLLEIDWQGAKQIVERVKTHEVVSVFILPPSMAVLEKRLRNREKDDTETISKRLMSAKEEIAQAAFYDYVMVNQDFEKAIIDLRAIVRANRLRLAVYQDLWQQLI